MSAKPHLRVVSSPHDDLTDFLSRTLAATGIHLLAPFGNRCDVSHLGNDIDSAIEHVVGWNGDDLRRNVYFTVNRVEGGLKRRATKADLIGLSFAHVSIIAPDCWGELAPQMVAAKLEKSPLPPSTIVCAEGSVHALWRLKPGANIDEVEGLNRRLATYFHGDDKACGADSVMPLPGTQHHPTAEQAAHGHKTSYVWLARADDGSSHAVEDMAAVFTPQRKSVEVEDVFGWAPYTRVRPSIDPPAWLQQERSWFCFKYEAVPGREKPNKIGYWPTGRKRVGVQGAPLDRENMTTYSEALEASDRFNMDGVALAFFPDCGYAVLDGDNCLTAGGAMHPDLLSFACRTLVTVSSGQKGCHIFFKGDLKSCRIPGQEGTYGLDVFGTSGWIAYTGRPLPALELVGSNRGIARVDNAVRDLIARRSGNRAAYSTAPDDFTAGWEPRVPDIDLERFRRDLQFIDPSCPREPWFNVLCAGHHQFDGDPAALDILVDWSSGGHNYIEGEVERYWEGMHGDGSGRRRITYAYILKLVKEARSKPADAGVVRAAAEALTVGLPTPVEVATPEGFGGKFAVMSASEIAATKPASWHIKGVLPEAGLVVLYGPSGSGKSFVSLDMAGAIARGVDWRGRRVRQGRVVIVAAEGREGYGKRIRAYCEANFLDPHLLPVGLVAATPSLLAKEDVEELAASVRAAGGGEGVALVIIDTLAQVTAGGDENSGKDMGLAIANAQSLHQVTGATIVLIHHTGKDESRGARGWSGLKAAVDAEIKVARSGGRGSISLSKMKDGEDGLKWGFALKTFVLGHDEDGDPITSCVIEATDAPEFDAEEGGGSPAARVARGGRREPWGEHIKAAFDKLPKDLTSTPLRDFVKLVANEAPRKTGVARDTRAECARQAIQEMARRGTGPLCVEGSGATASVTFSDR